MSRCKCGTRPKATAPPILTLRPQDLGEPNYFVLGIFVSLPPPPPLFSIVYAEDAATFCNKDPQRLRDEFAPYSTEASTNALKKLWYKNCECAPEQGTYTILIMYEGDGLFGGSDWITFITDSGVSINTGVKPVGLSVEREALPDELFVYSVYANPPGAVKILIGDMGRPGGAGFRIRVLSISVKFEPSGCYQAPPPENLPDGDYPSFPSIPYPVPPPVAFIPPEPELDPIKLPPPLPPPDECCDCE